MQHCVTILIFQSAEFNCVYLCLENSTVIACIMVIRDPSVNHIILLSIGRPFSQIRLGREVDPKTTAEDDIPCLILEYPKNIIVYYLIVQLIPGVFYKHTQMRYILILVIVFLAVSFIFICRGGRFRDLSKVQIFLLFFIM